VYDPAVIGLDTRRQRQWRPQDFGRRPAKKVADPVIEPLWTGIRVLAWVEAGVAQLVDVDGTTIAKPDIVEAVARATRASTAVLDGYLTTEVTRSDVGLVPVPANEAPTSGDVARQMIVGSGPNRTRSIAARATEVEANMRMADAVLEGKAAAALVAVDILELDGESLLDVPLLERKRLLDSVVVEEDGVRIGIHVRPPVDPWLGTWRMLGIRNLAFKGANSRYRPGEPNDDWASAQIPRR
jgi:ATP-dependent DNA ligase